MRINRNISLLSAFIVLILLFSVGMVLFAVAGQLFGVALSKPCIAEIKINHEIIDEADDQGIFSPEPPPTAKDIIGLIDEADERDDVAGIVVYVDSPGGEVIASREIYERIKSSKKPTVAYLRNIATSGGYYVAAGSDYIISEPETITGSIGVRATFVSMRSLFDKIGVNYTTVKSGKHKDIGDIGRNLTDEEYQMMQKFIDEVFDEFKSSVYESRKGHARFSDDSFNDVLDARIMSGREAYMRGLVDELGSEQEAYDKAAELAGISDYSRCELSSRKGIFRSFIQELARPIGITVNVNLNLEESKIGMSYR